ncbi:class I SAM-dependent methyltransferase [Paenibacillus thalictri]|uniref:Class I SAM-dependent methyltransferase n=1 Tax=Paenibacillus thalictri TaxID=2527873 RepID=A0A4Q9DIC3_9BACL|nr:class I SAM-dependent methyltransferase [Paenibacillus thalictri]TBL73002.1 class I SAM-dependent methyltransferase [Paenibacillus thalictri]
MDNQKKEWETSYLNRDNFVFYPHEEVIRFTSKYIRKRIGLNEFKETQNQFAHPKVLDLGCGIGRHVIYLSQMELDAYGVDLSEYAVDTAKGWASQQGISQLEEKIKVGDIRSLPWDDGFFHYAVSHGVLDSMHFKIARDAVKDLFRVMVPGGLFYCDLVSGDDSSHSREFCGEDIVAEDHEKGTVQSYFNYEKLVDLFNGYFEFVEVLLIRKENIHTGSFISRYHLVLRRI